MKRSAYLQELLEPRVLLAATEVIRNGGFAGTVSPSDWAVAGHLQADSRFSNYHDGPGYAYLANLDGTSGNNLAGSMYQQFTVPGNATSLTLSFWTRITTSESTTTLQNDTLSVSVMDSTGATTLQSITTLSNLNASGSYVKRQFALSRSIIGQTVRLVFNGATNASLPTTFRVDDVNLNAVSPATSNRVVGYLPQYRYSSFTKLDLTALTHINYFSVAAATDGSLDTSDVNVANMATVVDAMHAAGGTVSIVIGPQTFTTLSASSTARVNFAANIVAFALANNLDGIDIDWEPPAGNNYTNYGLLINDLHAQASPQHMLITSAVHPWTNEIPVAVVNSKMDWLNIMCYNFSYANHATYADSVNSMIDWTNYGVARNKIVMGVPFYGREGTSWSDTSTITYTALASNYFAAHGAYPAPALDLVDGWYINGVETLRKKAQYIANNAYGGMMIWELGQDHWNAANNYDYSSLLPVIKSVILPSTTITSVSVSPADNSYAPLNGTQNVSVTVTINAPGSGVLQVGLVGSNPTTPQDHVVVGAAGSFTHTFTLPVSQATAGTHLYEVYTQFRPGAASGPLADLADNDAINLKAHQLNWQTFPSPPASPVPADGALLTALPSVLDWANTANATSYDVYVNGVFRQNVTSSQWTRNISLAPNVAHTWQVIAKNAYGSTPGPMWTFSYDSTAPSFAGASYEVNTLAITLSASENLTAPAGDAYIALAPGGAETSIGAGTIAGLTVYYTFPALIADGDYSFRLPAGTVRDAAGNFNASDWTSSFFFLRGDANQDRKVDTQDFNRLAAHFGGSSKLFSQGDFNYDALVDSSDFNTLIAQYGIRLATPAPLAAAPGLFGTTSLPEEDADPLA